MVVAAVFWSPAAELVVVDSRAGAGGGGMGAPKPHGEGGW